MSTAKVALGLLESESPVPRRIRAWALPEPLPTVSGGHGRPAPPRARAWEMLVDQLEGSRSGAIRSVARAWPVEGERTWPAGWLDRVTRSGEPPPSEEALSCADAISLAFYQSKLSVGQLRRLFGHPALGHVRNLWLYCCATKGKWLGDLCKSLHVAALRFLNLHGTNVDGSAALGLSTSRGFVGLERLDIGFNSIRDGLPAFLGEVPEGSMPALRSINARSNGVSDAAFEALADTHAAPAQLTCLVLAGNDLAVRGARALAQRWEPLQRLEHLDVSATKIGDEGLAALAGSPRLGRLSSLACGGARTGVTARGVASLLSSPQRRGLRELDLSHVRLGDALPGLLADSDLAGGLTRLTAGSCGLQDADVLAMAPHLSSLEELGLAHNSIGEPTVERLLEACPRLEQLDLTSNSFDEAAARRLLRSARSSQLRALRLTFYGDVHEHPARAELAQLAAERGIALTLA